MAFLKFSFYFYIIIRLYTVIYLFQWNFNSSKYILFPEVRELRSLYIYSYFLCHCLWLFFFNFCNRIYRMQMIFKQIHLTHRWEPNNYYQLLFIRIIVRVLDNGTRDGDSIPRQVIPKTRKMILYASFIVRIKDKCRKPGKGVIPSSTLRCWSYCKGVIGSPLTTVGQITKLIKVNLGVMAKKGYSTLSSVKKWIFITKYCLISNLRHSFLCDLNPLLGIKSEYSWHHWKDGCLRSVMMFHHFFDKI